MYIRFSRDLDKKLKQIKRKDKKLHTKIKKQVLLFSTDPKHPSLRIHRLSGKMKNMWSLSIDKSYRMVYLRLRDDTAYFVSIGTHDDVYKK